MAMRPFKFPKLFHRRDEIDTPISSIPDPILEEIISRVPLKTVLRCTTVCKPWHSIIRNPTFAKNYLSNSPTFPLILFAAPCGGKMILAAHLVEGETISDLTRVEEKSIIGLLGAESATLDEHVTSCEGVVCWKTRTPYGDRVIIWNPIVREFVILDHQNHDPEEQSFFIGLGFRRETKTYELLRMTKRFLNDNEVMWCVEISTVGTKCWRTVGDFGSRPYDFSRKPWDLMYVDGALYWMYDQDIFVFDFNRVLFHVVQFPPTRVNEAKLTSLGVLRDSLCVVMVSSDGMHMELWILMKRVIGSWEKLYDMETTEDLMEQDDWSGPFSEYRTIKYLDSGEILMHNSRDTFITYDPVTKIETIFRVPGHTYHSDIRVVPHVPSILTLRDALNMEQGMHLNIEKAFLLSK